MSHQKSWDKHQVNNFDMILAKIFESIKVHNIYLISGDMKFENKQDKFFYIKALLLREVKLVFISIVWKSFQ